MRLWISWFHMPNDKVPLGRWLNPVACDPPDSPVLFRGWGRVFPVSAATPGPPMRAALGLILTVDVGVCPPLRFGSSEVDGVCVRSIPLSRDPSPCPNALSVSIVSTLRSREEELASDADARWAGRATVTPWTPERRVVFSPSTIRKAPLSASRSWRTFCSSSSICALCLRSVDTIRLA